MTTESATRETKADRTRRRILQSAAHELVEHGYAGASLRRIGDGAGLKFGSVYFHFESKDELIYEVTRFVMDYGIDQLRLALDEAGPESDAGDRVRVAIKTHLRVLHDGGDWGAAVAQGPQGFPVALRDEWNAHIQRYTDIWDELLRAARAAGAIDPYLDIETLRELVISAMNGTATIRPRDRASLDRAEQTLIDLLVRPVRETRAS